MHSAVAIREEKNDDDHLAKFISQKVHVINFHLQAYMHLFTIIAMTPQVITNISKLMSKKGLKRKIYWKSLCVPFYCKHVFDFFLYWQDRQQFSRIHKSFVYSMKSAFKVLCVVACVNGIIIYFIALDIMMNY